MNWLIATVVIALVAISKKIKQAPRGYLMRMNAQGQMQAAPRSGDSFPGGQGRYWPWPLSRVGRG
jgi:hypothetical protein